MSEYLVAGVMMIPETQERHWSISGDLVFKTLKQAQDQAEHYNKTIGNRNYKFRVLKVEPEKE